MVFLVLSYTSCSRVTYWGGSPMRRGTFEASLAYIIFYQTLSPLSGGVIIKTQSDTVPCLWKEGLPQGENLSTTLMPWDHIWLSTAFFDTFVPRFPYLQHRDPCLDSPWLRLQRGLMLGLAHGYPLSPPVSLPSWAAFTSSCRARAQWQQKTPRALHLLGGEAVRGVGKLHKRPGGSM